MSRVVASPIPLTPSRISAAVGLTPAQHAPVDRRLSDGVAQALPDVIRYRTVPLPEAEGAALEASREQRRAAKGERSRTEVLAEEQRRHLPAGRQSGRETGT